MVRGLNGGESVVRPDEALLLTAAAIASEDSFLLAALDTGVQTVQYSTTFIVALSKIWVRAKKKYLFFEVSFYIPIPTRQLKFESTSMQEKPR